MCRDHRGQSPITCGFTPGSPAPQGRQRRLDNPFRWQPEKCSVCAGIRTPVRNSLGEQDGGQGKHGFTLIRRYLDTTFFPDTPTHRYPDTFRRNMHPPSPPPAFPPRLRVPIPPYSLTPIPEPVPRGRAFPSVSPRHRVPASSDGALLNTPRPSPIAYRPLFPLALGLIFHPACWVNLKHQTCTC